jgi:predicted GNAT family acetyltransferase
MTGPELRAEADLYASLPLGPAAPWRHWLATTGGPNSDRQPIGMVSGLFTDETVMIEHVGVIPARRGAGIGATLVTTVVTDAVEPETPSRFWQVFARQKVGRRCAAELPLAMR